MAQCSVAVAAVLEISDSIPELDQIFISELGVYYVSYLFYVPITQALLTFALDDVVCKMFEVFTYIN